MKEKISYKDLDGWLKTVVVFGWISVGLMSLGFLVGLLEGLGY